MSARSNYASGTQPFLIMAKIINGISRKMSTENIKKYLALILEDGNFNTCAYVYALYMAEEETQEEIRRGRFLSGSPAANFFGRAVSVMLFKALTKYGVINKRFVHLLNEVKAEYAGARGEGAPKFAAVPLGYGALAEDNTLPNTGATGDATPAELADFELFIKIQDNLIHQYAHLPEGTGPGNSIALLGKAAAKRAAQKYIDELKDKFLATHPWEEGFGQTFRSVIETNFAPANFTREFPNAGTPSYAPTGRAGNMMPVNRGGKPFAFVPGGRSAAASGGAGAGSASATEVAASGGGSAAAPVMAPVAVAASGGGSAAAPVMAPVATNAAAAPLAPSAGAGAANAAAAPPKKDKKQKKEKGGQGGGGRTKKRKYRSSHQKKSQKKSRKSRKSQKTRSRRHR